MLVEAWVTLLAVDAHLRLQPERVSQSLWTPPPVGRATRSRHRAESVARLHRLVAVAARCHLLPMRCLQRSLALQRLLARRGIAADLRIGVRRGPEGVAAHAWLEWEGQLISEPERVTTEFARLEPRGAGR